jgi:hypothetical protein
MGNVVPLGGVDVIGGGATPGVDGVDVIGGSATPGVDTLTPGLITFPPMIVAPILTLIRPTLGGTNESEPAGSCGMVGVVAALATPVDAVRHNALSAAAPAANLGKCTLSPCGYSRVRARDPPGFRRGANDRGADRDADRTDRGSHERQGHRRERRQCADGPGVPATG